MNDLIVMKILKKMRNMYVLRRIYMENESKNEIDVITVL